MISLSCRCGGTAKIIDVMYEDHPSWYVIVQCTSCGANIPAKTKDKAVEAWYIFSNGMANNVINPTAPQ